MKIGVLGGFRTELPRYATNLAGVDSSLGPDWASFLNPATSPQDNRGPRPLKDSSGRVIGPQRTGDRAELRVHDLAVVTVLTIAQDEEVNLPACIESVRATGLPHLVVDGGSSDSTVSIAESAGVTVAHRVFEDTAAQYNWGLKHVSTPWAFVLDADETLDEQLAQFLRDFVGDDEVVAFECPRRNLFVSHWMRSGAWYPDYNMRLLKVGCVSYESREVHSRVVVDGATSRIAGHILHRTHPDVESYMRKLNDYTTREVEARRHATEQGVERKARLRAFWFKTPFRPLSRFLLDFVWRRGYRDGRVGFDLAVLSAFYEFVVGVKTRYPAESALRVGRSEQAIEEGSKRSTPAKAGARRRLFRPRPPAERP